MQRRKAAAITAITASLAALTASGCDRASSAPAAPARGSPVAAAADLPSTRTLSEDAGKRYIADHANALIRRWRPLGFDGDLAAYKPGDFGSPAAQRLLSSACRDSPIWRRVQSFQAQMTEIPSAAASPQGAVVYAPFWEKGRWGRTTLVGVRVPEGQCGALDIVDGAVSADGDGDVVSLLLAAAGIRQSGDNAARSAPSRSVREAAVEWVSQTLTPAAPEAASPPAEPPQPDAPMQVYSTAAFRSLLAGKSKQEVIALLGRPIAVHDSYPPGSQSYDYSSDETYLGPVRFRVTDETTGLTLRAVQVNIGIDGRVSGINF